jgi:hypothetical protein
MHQVTETAPATPETRKAYPGAREKTKTKEAKGRDRKKGAGSKSGPANRRVKGGSDDEVKELKSAQKQAAELAKGQWSDDDKLKVVEYITDEKIWKDFRATKARDFVHVRMEFISCQRAC